MQFHWADHYERSGIELKAKPDTSLLVVDYRDSHTDVGGDARLAVVPFADVVAVAMVFAEALIAERPFEVLIAEPELVIQVQRSSETDLHPWSTYSNRETEPDE